MRALPCHREFTAFIPASAADVFAHVDDHARLSSHMNKSSWVMGGGRMAIGSDGNHGVTVGSRIRMTGRVFGIRLSVEEDVIERNPPFRKVWETVGRPRLLVIGHYRMGFDITPRYEGCLLRVFIDYALPEHPPARWFARVLGSWYARWCVRRMVEDAVASFTPPSVLAAA